MVRTWVALGALTGVLTMATDAAACGGGVVSTKTSSSGVTANAQRVFFSLHDGVTEVVVQIGVPGGAESYGALLPVSGEPVLDSSPIPVADLDALDQSTAPTIVREEIEPGSSGGGCACFPGVGSADSTKGGGVPSEVQVGAPVNVGPVSATVLRASDEQALRGWLEENEFALPEGSDGVLGEYIGTDRYFVALRRSDPAASSEPSSIGLHFTVPGDGRFVPMRFARLGATGSQAFTLFFVAGDTVGPMPGYAALTLDDLDENDLWDASYEVAVSRAVARRASKAFVLERTLSLDAAQPGGLLRALTSPGTILTRMTSVVSETPDEDAYFDKLESMSVPSSRHVTRTLSSSAPPLAGLAFLGFTCVRRRRRR